MEKQKILIVDDSEMNRDLLKKYIYIWKTNMIL